MQDGKTASLTAPNGLAQEKLIRAALADAGLTPNDVSYIEAHGTGTKLGDPIETAALSTVFGSNDEGCNRSVYVGSVKANIGHLEAAAGGAGLLSALLALHHGSSPPNAQLRELNPEVALSIEGSRLVISKTSEKLERPDDGTRLIAGISSFGFSGTIAHVILEEAPDANRREISEHQSFLLSNPSSSRKRYSRGVCNHRMLQRESHEIYSGNKVYSVHLHGFIKDGIGTHLVDLYDFTLNGSIGLRMEYLAAQLNIEDVITSKAPIFSSPHAAMKQLQRLRLHVS